MKTDKGTVIGKGRWLILDSQTEALGVREAIGRALDAAVSDEREVQEEYDKAKALLDELQARLDECVKTTRNYRALYERISFVARKHSDEEEKQCDCYHPNGYCLGTKEMDECGCGGDESKCDFYDYKRRKANDNDL